MTSRLKTPLRLVEDTGADNDAGMARILVTESIADGGLDRLRADGHDVDVREGLDRAGLLEAVRGAAALIIRSATQVDDEVLAAGSDLVVVGRAGIGLDNVDVAAATARGVMVVNAPQSNIVSAAEHTMALPSRRLATSRRPMRPSWRVDGSALVGKASNSPTRRWRSSVSAGSASWWLSGPAPSA